MTNATGSPSEQKEERIAAAARAVREFRAKYPRKQAEIRPMMPHVSTWEMLAKSSIFETKRPDNLIVQTNDTVVVSPRH